MCGRFAITATWDEIVRAFKLRNYVVWRKNYNVAPGQYVAVIREQGNIEFLRWGLLPWDKASTQIINARVETILQKPTFKQSVEQRRCLIIANGYYEWRQQERIKQPYYITTQDNRPLAFAGIWNQDGCAVITTAARQELMWLHARMPLMVPDYCHESWLNKKNKFINLHADIVDAESGIDSIVDGNIDMFAGAANAVGIKSSALVSMPVTPQMNSPKFNNVLCVQDLGA